MIQTYFFSLTISQILLFTFIENILIFLISIATAEILDFLFKSRISTTPRKITATEALLAGVCVFNNCVITVIGFYLWKDHFIQIQDGTSWIVDLFYFFLLFFIMDLAMYVFHRVAHIKQIYTVVHKTHHQFVEARPLTLFALNPIETLGFGSLWLVVLFIVSPTWPAIILYLILNVIFGSLGHMSAEPFSKSWARVPILNQLTTRTFHALHHQNIEKNYGFYTTIWDNLGKTLFPNYEIIFEKATQNKNMK